MSYRVKFEKCANIVLLVFFFGVKGSLLLLLKWRQITLNKIKEHPWILWMVIIQNGFISIDCLFLFIIFLRYFVVKK